MRVRKSRKKNRELLRNKKKPVIVNRRRFGRDTRHLFDLVFKLLMQEASSLALVQFINGLFGKSFRPDTKIHKEITEHIIELRNGLEIIRSDCILEVADDDYMIEVQIGNDPVIASRIFDYGIAQARKRGRLSEDGSTLYLRLGYSALIYLEPMNTTPDVITIQLRNPQGEVFNYITVPYKVTGESFKEVEVRNLHLLLPFYLLLYRQEVKTPLKHGRSRQELAQAVAALNEEAEAMLERGLERGVLTDKDALLVVERIKQMHTELYGTYTEFQEEEMRLQTQFKSKVLAQFDAQEAQWKAREQKAFKEGEDKVIGLLKQGHNLEEVERLLAQEAVPQTS